MEELNLWELPSSLTEDGFQFDWLVDSNSVGVSDSSSSQSQSIESSPLLESNEAVVLDLATLPAELLLEQHNNNNSYEWLNSSPLNSHGIDMDPSTSTFSFADATPLSTASAPSLSIESVLKCKKGRPKKKRQRSDDALDIEESSDVSAVQLSKDQLIKFSSADLENFIRTIVQQRPLSSAEEKELKRQRRLIKNRESAQLSREKKKQHVGELEIEIAKLKKENENLQAELKKMKQENLSLRSELFKFVPKKIESQQTDIAAARPAQPLKTAGVTLLVLLFSFGLLFNSFGGLLKPLTPIAVPKIIREPIPQVIPTASVGTVFSRVLQEATLNPPSQQSKQISLDPTEQPPPFVHQPIVAQLKDEKRGDVTPADNATTELFLNEFGNESIPTSPKSADSSLTAWFNSNIAPKPNTAYIACGETLPLIPKEPQPMDPNQPLYISFLLPSQNLTANGDDVFLEVECQVLNIAVTNVPRLSKVI